MEMTCPKCQAPMRQYERSGVTIDQCTECRGLFLDRGELERLADAENAWHQAPAPPPPQPQPQPQYQQPHQQPQYQQRPRYRDYDSDEYPMYGQGGHGRRKKRSFLGELFD